MVLTKVKVMVRWRGKKRSDERVRIRSRMRVRASADPSRVNSHDSARSSSSVGGPGRESSTIHERITHHHNHLRRTST